MFDYRSRRPSWTSSMQPSAPSGAWRPQTPMGPQAGGYQPQMPPMQQQMPPMQQQGPTQPPPVGWTPPPPGQEMMQRGPQVGLPPQVPVNQPQITPPPTGGFGQGLLSFIQSPQGREMMSSMGQQMLASRAPQMPMGGGMPAPQGRQTMAMPQPALPWWARR